MPAPKSFLLAPIPFAVAMAAASPAMAAPGATVISVGGSTETLSATAPWWERLVVTVGDEGEARACQFETSIEPGQQRPCDVERASSAKAGQGLPEQVTRITFERRFSPAASLADSEVAAGDNLLGKSVLALAIGADGKVLGCKVIAAGGMRPDYGCKEAAAEKFEASAGSGGEVAARVATLTILVYAHEEDQV